jgi:ABC-2 type transport system ATP-binding protein
MSSPSLLILDEPADGVDPVGRRQIRDILQALEEKGVTVFLNSHLLAEVELFCRDVAIIHKGKVALTGQVKKLIAGRGYRLEAEMLPERLQTELSALALTASARDGSVEFIFATREAANRAIDLLRAERCDVEGLVRIQSTLEEVFMKTVEAPESPK